MGVIEFLEPEFDLNNVVNGLCVNFDGSRRVMRHAIAHEMIQRALPPIVTSRFLYIPNSCDHRTVPITKHKIQLPSEVALTIARFLVGSARDLDALAAASKAFRAVARSPEVLEALTQAWLPAISQCTVATKEFLSPLVIDDVFQHSTYGRRFWMGRRALAVCSTWVYSWNMVGIGARSKR